MLNDSVKSVLNKLVYKKENKQILLREKYEKYFSGQDIRGECLLNRE